MLRPILGLSLAAGALAHGAMQQPRTWYDPHGFFGMQAGTQCWAGCHGTAPGSKERGTRGCACQWYTNGTHIPGPPTISRDSPMRTYRDWDFGTGKLTDWTTTNPWRAPGTAPIWSPCGVDGGNLQGCPLGNPQPTGCAPGGYGRGPDARDIYSTFSAVTSTWEVGTEVEAAWGITANHGGGYSYRLCKTPKDMKELTEECFQNMVLDFAGDTQWAQFGPDPLKRIGFPARRTTEGTYPKGSMWTRNPIPACSSPGGGSISGDHGECGTGPWGNSTGPGVQFPPPFPFGYGFGNHDPSLPGGDQGGIMKWSIVDKLKIPEDLEPGDYVLSWRWDGEQTPQVWNSCANVQIKPKVESFV